MKAKRSFILCGICGFAAAFLANSALGQFKAANFPKPTQHEIEAIRLAAKRELEMVVPHDQWRIIGGETNYAKGPGWVILVGRVHSTDNERNAVLVEGWIEETDTGSIQHGQFLLRGFDFSKHKNSVFQNSRKGPVFTAKRGGMSAGWYGSAILLDYGQVWTPTKEWLEAQEEIRKQAKEKREAAAKEKADAKKTKADEAALKFNQTQAEKGDAQGLFRMGERYRDGDGVDPDPAKARDHFQRAQAAGHLDAAKALAELVESP